jgi:hypothetical protein
MLVLQVQHLKDCASQSLVAEMLAYIAMDGLNLKALCDEAKGDGLMLTGSALGFIR